MGIFEKLNETDLTMIADYIENYAGYDNTITIEAPLSHILRFWDKNKAALFGVLGGEFIRERQVSFSKPINMIEDEIMYMLNNEGRPFYDAYQGWYRNTGIPLGDDAYWGVRELIGCSELATNVYTGCSFSLLTPDNHTIDVNKGCKISKVLGKIAKAYGLSGFEEFRIAHSQCLNQKALNGTLCVSIHPLDYMTMSDNDSGWSSCMSWQECGDYRQGTVEMMNSGCIVIAYLKSSSDMTVPFGHQWNNKKWRQLYIVTPHIITGIREYPYENPELNSITLKWLRELVCANTTWGPFQDTLSTVKNGCGLQNTIAELDHPVSLDFYTNMMYNDFHCERPAYIALTIPEKYDLCFSGESECMQCGDVIVDNDNTNGLVCGSCDGHVWCSECGERIHQSDAITTPDGCIVCAYCYDNHYVSCNECDETVHESYITPVYLRHNGEVTSYHYDVCDACIASEAFAKRFGKTAHSAPKDHPWWGERTVVDLINLVDTDALDCFDIWNQEDYDQFVKILEARDNLTDSLKASDEI